MRLPLHSPGRQQDAHLPRVPSRSRVFRESLALGAASIGILLLERALRAKSRRDVYRLRFLSDAGRTLVASQDLDDTLRRVAQTAVSGFADWCIIDLRDPKFGLRRVAAAHRDPVLHERAQELLRYPLTLRTRSVPFLALQQQRTRLISSMTEPLIEESTEAGAHRSLVRRLGIRSVLCVPMIGSDGAAGVATFVRGNSAHPFDVTDRTIAEELCVRAALAIERALRQQEAQEAIRARDEVVAIVSHDLRGAVDLLGMSCELLRVQNLSEERRRAQIEVMARTASQLRRTLEDLLDVSKIEAGGLAVDLAPVAVSDLLREVDAQFRALVEAHGRRLIVRDARDAGRVQCDFSRMMQVFSNLIGNATKYSCDGSTITVGAQPRDALVELYVHNEGDGIPRDQIPHIFDRFWQARTARRMGAGLGLAIVRGIVDAHGGSVRAESIPGDGATIYFTVRKA